MTHVRLMGLILLAVLIGCSGGVEPESAAPPELTPQQSLKKSLNQVLESGAPGSEIGGVMESIEALRETDPALASALEVDADELMRVMSLNDPAGMEAIVAEMLTKLDGDGT